MARALEGLMVLDLAAFVAAPFCCTLLGEFGAGVIQYQAGDGGWIAIACTNDRMFERLVVDAMGQPHLLAEFGTMQERIRRRDVPPKSHGTAPPLRRRDSTRHPFGLFGYAPTASSCSACRRSCRVRRAYLRRFNTA